jgi:Tfp pilus assembly protein PilZ
MYSIGDDEFLLADVLSLSMQGLFFKASSRLSKGDRIKVVFPLFGQCKEIEVKASVLYTIQPEAENNFFQGFGVGFDDIPEELAEQLQIYIREYFLREVSASNDGVGNFTAGQLQN